MGLAAVFGQSDPECASLLSRLPEPCSVLASFDWCAALEAPFGVRTFPLFLPPRILERYAIRKPDFGSGVAPRTPRSLARTTKDLELGRLIMYFLGAAGLATCPLPAEGEQSNIRAEALFRTLSAAYVTVIEIWDQDYGSGSAAGSDESRSAYTLAVGFGFRALRLCLPYVQEGLRMRGFSHQFALRLQEITGKVLEALTEAVESFPLVLSPEDCTDLHLTVLAEEAAAFILEAAAFLQEGASVGGGQGDESKVGYCNAIAALLGLGRSDPQAAFFSNKTNDRGFHQILQARLFSSPPSPDDPSGPGSCFPLDPIHLLKNCLQIYSAQSLRPWVPREKRSSSKIYIMVLLDFLARSSEQMPASLALDQRRTATLAGLLCSLVRSISSILRSILRFARLDQEHVNRLYCILKSCFSLLDRLVSSGLISPIDLSRACSDAVSDMIYLMIVRPRIVYTERARAGLNSMAASLTSILTPLFANPVSRADLMRATMRSGTLDVLRAALSSNDIRFPASAAPGISSGAPGTCREVFYRLLVTCLYSLGTARDRGPGGLAHWRNYPGTSESLLVGGSCWDLREPGTFGFQLRFKLALRDGRPAGAGMFNEEDLDLGPAIHTLERDALELPGSAGGWAAQGVGEMVHALHGVVESCVSQLEFRLESASRSLASALESNRGREHRGWGALAPLRRRVEFLFGRLDAFSAWRTRLRHLGRRLVVDSLSRAEERDAAVWVLSPEEVVGLVRGAGEGPGPLQLTVALGGC